MTYVILYVIIGILMATAGARHSDKMMGAWHFVIVLTLWLPMVAFMAFFNGGDSDGSDREA